MAQTLSSPGVSVEVRDESFYTSSAPGTIPLIFVATAANKPNGSGTGIAPGTLKKNDGTVYLLTGQKDLTEKFGTPIFKTDSSNNPVHAGEQNEYGLQAAYSYLGADGGSNRAYVLRADVDLDQLKPLSKAPTGAPDNGTFWLDTTSTHWGIFQWNSDSATTPLGQTFSNIVPMVITDPTQVVDFSGSDYTPKASIGVTGSYAVVAVTSLASVWYRSPRTKTWVQVGTSEWVSSIPTISCTKAETSFTLLDQATASEDIDSITINGESFDGVTTLSALVTAINNNDILEGVSASIANGKLIIYSTGTTLDLTGTLPQTAAKLGVTIGVYAAPAMEMSPHTSVPAFKRKDLTLTVNGRPTGSLWFKTTSSNRGADWFVQRYDTASQSWITAKAPLYPNGQTALKALDPNGGGLQLAGNTLYVKYNDSELETPLANFKIYRRKDVTATSIKSIVITPTTFGSGRYTFQLEESVKNSSTLQSRDVEFTIPTFPSGLTDAEKVDAIIEVILQGINTVDEGVTTYVHSSRIANSIVISHQLGGDIVFTDGTGEPIPSMFSTVTTENFYHHASYANGVPGNEYKYIASLWTEFSNDKSTSFITPSDTVLTGGPVDGMLWFDPNQEVDIMVKDDNVWRAYRNVDHGDGPGATDPKGPIISASKPTTQHDGQQLVEGDLWIDMSDAENYPALYRYINFEKKWVRIDITDQETENGIIFADARWNTNGQSAEPSSIVELLGGRLGTELSAEQRAAADFVDFDAPDPSLHAKGMLLWNLRRSGNNVKRMRKGYVSLTDRNIRYNNELMSSYYPNVWVSEAANLTSGAGAFGRLAQRGVVVQALQAAVNKNQQIRETDYRIFNLIACPGYPELVGEMKILNYDRGITAFVIGDTPARLPADGTLLLNWGNNANNAAEDGDLGLTTSDEYLAFFYPWGYTSDNLGNHIMVPPSHMMLRTIALSDSATHPWFAPAGFTRGKINNADTVGYVNSSGEYVPVSLSNTLRDTLASIKVNPISFIPGSGAINMGQYTRATTASALDRINVARLVVELRRQFAELTRPYLFQPNDQSTRNAIKHAAESMLLELQGKQAIYDYAVVCDSSNNPASVVDRNELYLDVAIEPTKSVEFIYIPLRLKNTGEIKGLKGV